MLFIKNKFKILIFFLIVFFDIKSIENKKLIFALTSFLIGYKNKKIFKLFYDIMPIAFLYGAFEFNNFIKKDKGFMLDISFKALEYLIMPKI